MKKVMADLNIDVDRLPLGKLQRDQITKCFKILLQIQKILLSGDKNKEKFISSLSNDFYSIIPHNYGIKKPVNIDHLLRIKDKIKVLETVSAI
jgi:poly [ADP-ribose] polymerase